MPPTLRLCSACATRNSRSSTKWRHRPPPSTPVEFCGVLARSHSHSPDLPLLKPDRSLLAAGKIRSLQPCSHPTVIAPSSLTTLTTRDGFRLGGIPPVRIQTRASLPTPLRSVVSLPVLPWRQRRRQLGLGASLFSKGHTPPFRVVASAAFATSSRSQKQQQREVSTQRRPPDGQRRPDGRPKFSTYVLLLRLAIYLNCLIFVLSVVWYWQTSANLMTLGFEPALLRWLYPDPSPADAAAAGASGRDTGRSVGAERAHEVANATMKWLYDWNWHPRERFGGGIFEWVSDLRRQPTETTEKPIEIFGHSLTNPIGISAGLDKNAELPDALFALGPAIVEVGGCTPLPQPGNPRPRVFRVPGQEAVINRYGLNSLGADEMARTLAERVVEWNADRKGDSNAGAQHGSFLLDKASDILAHADVPCSLIPGKLLAVQIAKNKDTPDDDIEAVNRDYVYCVKRLAPYADILVVNVSSPNTPGLRTLQRIEPLTQILKAVVDASQQQANSSTRPPGGAWQNLRTQSTSRRCPAVMVKVSPDEDSSTQISDICTAIYTSGVDGVIVGNTTKRRPPFYDSHSGSALSSKEDIAPKVSGATADLSPAEHATLAQTGGYSGPLTFPKTLHLIKEYRARLDRMAAESSAHSSPPSSPISSPLEQSTLSPSPQADRKVIFASGGISNGTQVLAALDAGASVAQIYTALTYGGAGTVIRLKRELQAARDKRGERMA